MNILFKALTRPAMFLGLPLEIFVVFSFTTFLSGLYISGYIFAISIPLYIILKAIVLNDERKFRLIALKIRFFQIPLIKKFYGTNTFSSIKYDQSKSINHLPKLSILPLNSNPSFESLIPYSSLISDDVVITKDFMLISSWELAGDLFEAEYQKNINEKNDLLSKIFEDYATERVSFYFHNIRHSFSDSMKHNFENSYLDEINKKYYDEFSGNVLKKNSLYLTLIYDPVEKIEKGIFKNLSLAKKKEQIKKFLEDMKELSDRFEVGLKEFKPTKLKTYTYDNKEFSSQLEFYNYLIGARYFRVRAIDVPLINLLTGGLKNIQFNNDTLQLNYADSKVKFGRMLEIKDYSSETFSGILNAFMYTDTDYIITQSFNPINKLDAKKRLEKQRGQMISVKDDSLSQIMQFEEALDDLASGNLAFGDYHFSILILADDLKELKEKTNTIITEFNIAGFMPTLSSLSLPANYFSQWITNYAIRPRPVIISSKNYANLIALHNFANGKRDFNPWGEAVAILKTPNKTPYYFNFHELQGGNRINQSDLGHTFIVGKSGGGKTVLINFLITQLLKYAATDSFLKELPDSKKKFTCIYLDKDYGAMGNILCSGGKYLQVKSGEPTGFNPFMCENTPENVTNLTKLIKLLITRNNEVIKVKEEEAITKAIKFILNDISKEQRTYGISLLMENLTGDLGDDNSIKARLRIWSKGNKFGHIFDNEFDELSFDDNINIFGIDGSEFLDNTEISDPISFYLIYRSSELIDGRRMFFCIDEAWQWMRNPVVSDFIFDKLKTARKLNCILTLITQSIADFTSSSITKAIIEQSATMIFLPNSKAVKEEYTALNLSELEYERIKNFKPSRYEFFIKKAEEKAIAKLDLKSLGEKNLKILSTSKINVELLEAIFNDPNLSLEDKIYLYKEKLK